MKWFFEMLKGMVIGLANLIPGVSGGTMMVSMGIYDKLIGSITHLFRQFKKSILTLLPYLVGMLLAICIGAFGLKAAFAQFPLPTNALFIGLILGSLPMLLKQMKGEKLGVAGVIAFVLLFALVIVLDVIGAENSGTIQLSFLEVIKLFVMGAVCSATMVIPGVSGSMILKTLGYYEPVVTVAIPALLSGLKNGDWSAVGTNVGILLPFALGIVVGIFAIAKLIEVLMARWKGVTYCGILGMVLASPVVILRKPELYEGLNVWTVIASVVALAAGVAIAWLLGGSRDTAEKG